MSQGSNIGVSRGIETVARSWLSRGQIHRFWVNNVVDSTSVNCLKSYELYDAVAVPDRED